MLAYRGLILPGQEAEAVGDFPVLYRVSDVDEEPGYKEHYQKGGHNLHHPLDNQGVPPDWYVLIS